MYSPKLLIFGGCILFALLSTALGLSVDVAYPIVLQPVLNEDVGNGVHSMNFNHPYVTFRHSVSSTNKVSRITFEVSPMIPVDTQLTSFTYDISPKGLMNPPDWCSIVNSWSGSRQFLIEFNGGKYVDANTSPDRYIFEITGRVGYTYGPNKQVEYEDRVIRVILYLNVVTPLQSRPIISQHFTQGSASSNIQQFMTSNTNAVIPAFKLEDNEAYTFKCGGTAASLEGSCTLGTAKTVTVNDIVWGSELSQIIVESGVLRVVGALAHWGLIYVKPGAVLVLDGADQSTHFAIASNEGLTTFINDGTIIVNKGALRVIGTSITGKGQVVVAKTGKLEISPLGATVFGTTRDNGSGSNATSVTTSLYNEGEVSFISGEISFYSPLVSLATGKVNIGMSATINLFPSSASSSSSGGSEDKQDSDGSSTDDKDQDGEKIPTLHHPHVIGGIHNGVERITTFSSVNQLGLVCGGKLINHQGSHLLFGATARFDGLGRLHSSSRSIVLVNIEFFDLADFPIASISFAGPQTERPSAGLVCQGCDLIIQRGGVSLATGIHLTQQSSLTVHELGYLHLTGRYARNDLSGTGVFVNRGDMLLLNGASIEFNMEVQSFTHIRALSQHSAIYFSSSNQKPLTHRLYRPAGTRMVTSSITDSDITNDGAATNPTHLFGLFTLGLVVIRHGTTVELSTSDMKSIDNANQKEPARFFIAALYNSGHLAVENDAVLEVVSFTQNLEPISIAGVSHHNILTVPITTQNEGTSFTYFHELPTLVLRTQQASLQQVSGAKYSFDQSSGIIKEAVLDGSQDQLTAVNKALGKIDILFGTVHGVSTSKFKANLGLGEYSNFSPGLDAENRYVQYYSVKDKTILTHPQVEAVLKSTSNTNSFAALPTVLPPATSSPRHSSYKTLNNYEFIPATAFASSLTTFAKSSIDLDVLYVSNTHGVDSDQIIVYDKLALGGGILRLFTNIPIRDSKLIINAQRPMNTASMSTLSVLDYTRVMSVSSHNDDYGEEDGDDHSSQYYGHQPRPSVKFNYTLSGQQQQQAHLAASSIDGVTPQLGASNPKAVQLHALLAEDDPTGLGTIRTDKDAQDRVAITSVDTVNSNANENPTPESSIRTTSTSGTNDVVINESMFGDELFRIPIITAETITGSFDTIEIHAISSLTDHFNPSSGPVTGASTSKPGHQVTQHSWNGKSTVTFGVVYKDNKIELVAYHDKTSSAFSIMEGFSSSVLFIATLLLTAVIGVMQQHYYHVVA